MSDPLKKSIGAFLAWRRAESHRAKCKTRAQREVYCGYTETLHDGKLFCGDVALSWSSEKDARDNTYLGFYADRLGYYADLFEYSCIRFGVIIIGHRPGRGEGRQIYAPVTWLDDSDGYTVHLDRVCNTERDAVRMADRIAEQEAERCREDAAKDKAEQDIYDAKVRVHEINRGCLALLREIKAATLTPAICQALRDSVRQMLKDRASQFRIIADRRADYWSAA